MPCWISCSFHQSVVTIHNDPLTSPIKEILLGYRFPKGTTSYMLYSLRKKFSTKVRHTQKKSDRSIGVEIGVLFASDHQGLSLYLYQKCVKATQQHMIQLSYILHRQFFRYSFIYKLVSNKFQIVTLLYILFGNLESIYIKWFCFIFQHFDCRNHIRVIQSMGDGSRLYVCGTNAHNPKDWVINVSIWNESRWKWK